MALLRFQLSSHFRTTSHRNIQTLVTELDHDSLLQFASKICQQTLKVVRNRAAQRPKTKKKAKIQVNKMQKRTRSECRNLQIRRLGSVKNASSTMQSIRSEKTKDSDRRKQGKKKNSEKATICRKKEKSKRTYRALFCSEDRRRRRSTKLISSVSSLSREKT